MPDSHCCVRKTVWHGVIPGGQSFVIPVGALTEVASEGTGFNWTPSVRGGTTLLLVGGDDSGLGSAGSGSYNVGFGVNPDNSCLNSTSPSSTPGTPAGGSYPTSSTTPGTGNKGYVIHQYLPPDHQSYYTVETTLAPLWVALWVASLDFSRCFSSPSSSIAENMRRRVVKSGPWICSRAMKATVPPRTITYHSTTSPSLSLSQTLRANMDKPKLTPTAKVDRYQESPAVMASKVSVARQAQAPAPEEPRAPQACVP